MYSGQVVEFLLVFFKIKEPPMSLSYQIKNLFITFIFEEITEALMTNCVYLYGRSVVNLPNETLLKSSL